MQSCLQIDCTVGGGFMAVADHKNKMLPAAIHSHGEDVYNIAIFHQIHCLHQLVEDFDALFGIARSKTGKSLSPERLDHTRHCFAYLRSSLMCGADTALEGQSKHTKEPGTSGTGSYHICKDYDALLSWSESHRVSNMEGFH